MTQTATRRASPARKRPAAKRAAGSATAKAKRNVTGKTKKVVPAPNRLARKLATRAIRKLAAKALESGAETVRHAAELAAAGGSEAIELAVERAKHRRLPIQRAIDVAVPLRVAWEEWMVLETLPEGVDTVREVERDRMTLTGRLSGPRKVRWEAEVLDERECQSFAWQSHTGSDCAGLVTFHELSRRLTRIELNLDVVPTNVAQAVALATRLADHHAETELRSFKARLELINPDLYEEQEEEEEEVDGQDEESDEQEAADQAAGTRNGG